MSRHKINHSFIYSYLSIIIRHDTNCLFVCFLLGHCKSVLVVDFVVIVIFLIFFKVLYIFKVLYLFCIVNVTIVFSILNSK